MRVRVELLANIFATKSKTIGSRGDFSRRIFEAAYSICNEVVDPCGQQAAEVTHEGIDEGKKNEAADADTGLPCSHRHEQDAGDDGHGDDKINASDHFGALRDADVFDADLHWYPPENKIGGHNLPEATSWT